jgi:DNA-binding PadR family transcriptional regulator
MLPTITHQQYLVMNLIHGHDRLSGPELRKQLKPLNVLQTSGNFSEFMRRLKSEGWVNSKTDSIISPRIYTLTAQGEIELQKVWKFYGIRTVA